MGLTGSPELLRGPAGARGIPETHLIVRTVPPSDVPALLAAADCGLAFRAPSFSQLGVSPIKVGEYLLSGLPVVTNRGVGDLDSVLGRDAPAFVADRPAASVVEPAARWFMHDVLVRREECRERARALGLSRFGIEQMAAGYRRALAPAETRDDESGPS
jgi:glycosyltransferase involved in cell wall biosynthesis